jgi:hypothetical protein
MRTSYRNIDRQSEVPSYEWTRLPHKKSFNTNMLSVEPGHIFGLAQISLYI